MTRLRDTLLFDLDGTLTDTDALHFRAYQTLLASFGRTITHELYKQKIMGLANEAIMASLFPSESVQRHRAIAEEKERLFRSFAERMQPLAGLIELLAFADRHGVKMAVVTNAPRLNAEMMLNALGLSKRFPVLVIGDELARGKPDPLPYLTALERLDARADRALAFEDSRSGVQAASGAGVETIGITTGIDAATLRASGAAAAISDFTDSWLRARLEGEFVMGA